MFTSPCYWRRWRPLLLTVSSTSSLSCLTSLPSHSMKFLRIITFTLWFLTSVSVLPLLPLPVRLLPTSLSSSRLSLASFLREDFPGPSYTGLGPLSGHNSLCRSLSLKSLDCMVFPYCVFILPTRSWASPEQKQCESSLKLLCSGESFKQSRSWVNAELSS